MVLFLRRRENADSKKSFRSLGGVVSDIIKHASLERTLWLLLLSLFGNRFIYRREKIDPPMTCLCRENYYNVRDESDYFGISFFFFFSLEKIEGISKINELSVVISRNGETQSSLFWKRNRSIANESFQLARIITFRFRCRLSRCSFRFHFI